MNLPFELQDVEEGLKSVYANNSWSRSSDKGTVSLRESAKKNLLAVQVLKDRGETVMQIDVEGPFFEAIAESAGHKQSENTHKFFRDVSHDERRPMGPGGP